MSYGILKQNGQDTYNLKELVVDSFNEISTINKNQIAPGSTCFVIDTSEYYMLNTKKEWIKVKLSGNQPGSEEDTEIIYDGGNLEEQ